MKNKLNLKNITLCCYDGLQITDKESYKKILSYVTSWIDFKNIKIFCVNPFDFPGVDFFKINACNIQTYNKFIVGQLNSHIDTDFCLIFQLDGFPLNYEYWDFEFFNYDYIGAPWPHYYNLVGNGGFSLRSKKFLETSEKLINSCDGSPEDFFLLVTQKNELIKNKIKIAPLDIACKFSIENVMHTNHNLYSSFGFHAKWFLKDAINIVNHRLGLKYD